MTVRPSHQAVPQDKRDRGGPAQPLLIVDHLVKHFPVHRGVLNRRVGAVHAVDDVSFTVRKGETLGVVGESGCGKSTLARLLVDLLPRTSGTLVFDGDPVGDMRGVSLREFRRQVQIVFQDSAASLNPRAQLADTIAFGPRAHGVSRAVARQGAHDLLAKVGLAPALYARRFPHQLSGGQKQRVNIARALALEPRLVILDEAVSALDKSVAAQVLNLLRALKRQLALTYVFISHDLGVVRYLADRVLVMYLGQIVEIGPAEEVCGEPRHPYTQALLRSQLGTDPHIRIVQAPVGGDPPSPLDPPPGCRFAPRCPIAELVCTARMPALGNSLAGDHLAACHAADPTSGHSRASLLT